MLEKVKGIVIKTQDYGETHKLVTIISAKTGKITAIARGANKPKSRMAAVTQPFVYGDFLIFISSGLSTIRQGEIIDSLRPLREDIVKTAYGAYIAELTDKLLDAKKPDLYIYNELYETLQWIAANKDIEIPVMMYEMKLFKKGGFAPIVNECASCSSKKTPFSFSISEGGILCNSCIHLDQDAIVLPDSLIKLLNIFQNAELSRIGKISIKKANKVLLRNIFDAYYDQFGSFYLKSRNFLKQLDLLL